MRTLHVAGLLALLGSLACGGLLEPEIPAPAARAERGSSFSSCPTEAVQGLAIPASAARLGDAAAPWELVQVSDYACRPCAMAAEEGRLLAESRPDLQLRFLAFPLSGACNPLVRSSDQEERCEAARAGLCADRQGRFWDMQQALFADPQSLQREDLLRRARQLDLDPAAFERCLDDPETRARLEEEVQAALQVGVEGTPSLYVRDVSSGSSVRVNAIRCVQEVLDPPEPG